MAATSASTRENTTPPRRASTSFSSPPSGSSTKTVRRLSTSSNGRRRSLRKDQSLVGLSDSLGKQSLPRSSRDDVYDSPGSNRQLEYYEDDQAELAAHEDSEDDDDPLNATDVFSDDNLSDTDEPAPTSPVKVRRKTVWWTKDEEDFLRAGVRRHGEGKWKVILDEGHNVFLSHRTNVDLKDKWKNLTRKRKARQRRQETKPTPENHLGSPVYESTDSDDESYRPRRRVVENRDNDPEASPDVNTGDRHQEDATGMDTLASAALRSAEEKYTEPNAEQYDYADASLSPVDEIDRSEVPTSKPKISTAKRTRKNGRNLGKTGIRDMIELDFVTEESFPKAIPVAVDLNSCVDVDLLKQHLRHVLKGDVPEEAPFELVGKDSRRLLGDEDDLRACIDHDGQEYYVLI